MVTEIDHDAIKEQMVAILTAKATLYDITDPTKIRLINVGMPNSKTGFDNTLPSIYITNSNPLERIRQIGTMTQTGESLPPLEHEIRYKIVIGVDGKDSREAENKLDDFQKLVLETLEADHQFKNGGAATVDRSRPEMVEAFSVLNNNKPIQGRIITYNITKVTN